MEASALTFRNMDSLVFSEFCDRYCAVLRKVERERLGLNELLPTQPQRNHLDDDDDAFLAYATEGHYTTATAADV